jgi:hypothetical protein
MSNILLIIGAAAVIVGTLASRFRISPWWLLMPGAVASGVALLLFSPVAGCDAADAQEATFAVAALIGIGFYASTSVAAFVDGVRFVRRGTAARAGLRILPFLVGAALAVGTFFLALIALLSCVA